MPIALHNAAPVRQGPDNCSGWERYPANLEDHNVFNTALNNQSSLLSNPTNDLFSKKVNLNIIDVTDNGGNISSQSQLYTSEADVEAVLQKPDSTLPRMRIISLHSIKSPSPIEATESLIRKILTRYKVDPAFVQVLSSFGDNPHSSECGSTNLINSVSSNDYRNLAYQIRYAEKKAPDKPWGIRQTGVYHHSSLKTPKFDLFIVIHPVRESVFEEQLLDCFKTGTSSAGAKAIWQNPFRLHLLLFSLYVDNWRDYLRFLTDGFSKNNDVAMTINLQTVDVDSQGFYKVQELRDLKDDALSLSAYCKAGQDIIGTLKKIPDSGFESIWDLEPYDTRLEGFKQSLSILSSRISNTIDLYAYAVDFKNQITAANTNENVYHLSQKTTRDTTAVKWITYLTVFYVPGSFISSLYGMNLFVFNQATNRIVIAKDFWIFPVTFIPLTLLTYLLYKLVVQLHQPPGKTRWGWMRKFE